MLLSTLTSHLAGIYGDAEAIRIIKEAGRIPAACDCNFNILRIIE